MLWEDSFKYNVCQSEDVGSRCGQQGNQDGRHQIKYTACTQEYNH